MEKVIAAPSAVPAQPDGFPDCSRIHDVFSKCITMGSQIEHIRREGTADDCSKSFADYTTCLHSMLVSDPAKKKELYLTTHHYKDSVEALKHANNIFDFKEKPGWN